VYFPCFISSDFARGQLRKLVKYHIDFTIFDHAIPPLAKRYLFLFEFFPVPPHTQ